MTASVLEDPRVTSEVSGDDGEVLVLDRRGPVRSVEFLGVTFTPMPADTLQARVAEAGGDGAPFRYLVTPNVDHLVRLAGDPTLQPLYDGAWANVCDSRVVEVLARMSGITLPAAPGSDLAAALFAAEIRADEPIVVIGATSDVVQAVQARYGLTDLRWHEPPMGLRRNREAIAEAAAFAAQARARFTFICVGSPQQELVAQAIAARGDAIGIGLCLGASLDFLAGKTQRAPVWMQRARLEWLHRLASEPQRLWKRYLVEGPRIFALWRAWEAGRKAL